MIKWIFFEEGDISNPIFEIETKTNDSTKVYDLAYKTYGPQVEDLLYMQKK